MTAKQKRLIIDKSKTYISLGLVSGAIVGVFWAATEWTKVQAQVSQNTRDITSVKEELHDFRINLAETNKNLVDTNNSVIELNTLLKQGNR